MGDSSLAFGLDWDRDFFVDFAMTFRDYFWPISVFLIHPFTIYVLVRKSSMGIDCKTGFVLHHLLLMCFDFYNGALYQMYPMAPIPVFFCTGIFCHVAEATTLMTGQSVWTVLLCSPYLFIMVRMHQKLLFRGSPLKVSDRTQALILLIINAILVSNVFGFNYCALEPPNKREILKIPEISWANNFSSNFLVLGKKEGDIGSFAYELVLLIVSIFVIFSFYVLITYHAVKIGRQMDMKSSKTREAQLRFVYSLTAQACCTAIFFILPLLALFVGLVVIRNRLIFPGLLVASMRVSMLLAYNCCSILHAVVFLSRNRWILQFAHRALGISRSTSVTAVSLYRQSLPTLSTR